MTQENKVLLLKDLCARVPYGVNFHYFSEFADGEDSEFDNTITVIDIADEQILDEDHEDYIPIRQIMPYLRPMSSMTEKEKKVFNDFCVIDVFVWEGNAEIGYKNQANIMSEGVDWLLEHHFDYRGLIEKGLALEAPEDMYKEK